MDSTTPRLPVPSTALTPDKVHELEDEYERLSNGLYSKEKARLHGAYNKADPLASSFASPFAWACHHYLQRLSTAGHFDQTRVDDAWAATLLVSVFRMIYAWSHVENHDHVAKELRNKDGGFYHYFGTLVAAETLLDWGIPTVFSKGVIGKRTPDLLTRRSRHLGDFHHEIKAKGAFFPPYSLDITPEIIEDTVRRAIKDTQKQLTREKPGVLVLPMGPSRFVTPSGEFIAPLYSAIERATRRMGANHRGVAAVVVFPWVELRTRVDEHGVARMSPIYGPKYALNPWYPGKNPVSIELIP